MSDLDVTAPRYGDILPGPNGQIAGYFDGTFYRSADARYVRVNGRWESALQPVEGQWPPVQPEVPIGSFEDQLRDVVEDTQEQLVDVAGDAAGQAVDAAREGAFALLAKARQGDTTAKGVLALLVVALIAGYMLAPSVPWDHPLESEPTVVDELPAELATTTSLPALPEITAVPTTTPPTTAAPVTTTLFE